MRTFTVITLTEVDGEMYSETMTSEEIVNEFEKWELGHNIIVVEGSRVDYDELLKNVDKESQDENTNT